MKKADIIRHVEFHHLAKDEKALCTICNAQFRRKQHLIRHVKTKHRNNEKMILTSTELGKLSELKSALYILPI